MPRSVIPVLSTGQDQLTRPVDQIAYILRHAFYNPGWTSSYLEPYLISLQKLYAESHEDLNQMIDRLREKLAFTLNEMFNNAYHVNMEVYEIDPFTRGVKIGISDNNQNLVLSTDDLRISNGKFYIRSTTGDEE